MMGKLSEQDIQLAATIFDKLDYNGDGKIIFHVHVNRRTDMHAYIQYMHAFTYGHIDIHAWGQTDINAYIQ